MSHSPGMDTHIHTHRHAHAPAHVTNTHAHTHYKHTRPAHDHESLTKHRHETQSSDVLNSDDGQPLLISDENRMIGSHMETAN